MSSTIKILSIKKLLTLRELWRWEGRAVVFTNGVFDILHAGHVKTLEKARHEGDLLVVGINSDASVRLLKKAPGRPVNGWRDRAEVVAALGCVDAVVKFEEITPGRLMSRLKPDVQVKGGDYKPANLPEAKHAGRVVIVSLKKGYSTTGFIKRLQGLGSFVAILSNFALAGANSAGASTPRGHDLYLDRSVAPAEYCFNPNSKFLRERMAQRAPAFYKPAHLFDASALAADVSFLHKILKENYPGYATLAQRPGFDPAAFFASWEQRIRDHGPNVSYRDGVEEPFVQLRKVLLDMHFGIPPIRNAHPELSYHEYQAEVARDFDVKTCTLSNDDFAMPTTLRIAPLLKSNGALSRVLTVSVRSIDGHFAVHCGEKTIDLARRPPPPARRKEEQIYSYTRLGKVGVIRIRDFDGSDEELAQLKKIAEDYPLHHRHPVLIFDIRGNGGGNDEYLYDWVKRAKRGTWSDGVAVTQHGTLLPCYMWNIVLLRQFQYDTVDTPQAQAERAKLMEEWPPYQAGVFQTADDGLIQSEAKQPYVGRIFVLIDSETASSGESGAEAIRQALGATFVGERSGGFLEYGNEAVVLLPNTGLPWQFGTKRNYFNKPVEGVGLPVDYYLEDVGIPAEKLVPFFKTLPLPTSRH